MLQYQITTPEQVHFHYPLAGIVTRGLAWAIDQLVLLAATMALLMTLGWMGFFWGMAVFFVAKFLLDFGYYMACELYWSGQTLGKRAMGVRVMSATGGKLSFADVFVRTLMRVIDNPGMVPFFGLVGGVVALIDPMRRRLGDLAADTIVVRHAHVTLPQSMLTQNTRTNSFQSDPAIRNRILNRVTREERDLMLDLMVRRDELEPDTREAFFHQAATQFRKRYALPQDLDHLSDEQTVLNLALVVQGATFG